MRWAGTRAISLLPVLLSVPLVGVACSDDGGDDARGGGADAGSPTTVEVGEVATTELRAGDCLDGITIGAADRLELSSTRIVGCQGPHSLEVVATFALSPDDLDVEVLVDYPGRARVIAAADEGCTTRLADATGVEADDGPLTASATDEDERRYGLIVFWPSSTSWAQGDRTVACAAFPGDGMPFLMPVFAS